MRISRRASLGISAVLFALGVGAGLGVKAAVASPVVVASVESYAGHSGAAAFEPGARIECDTSATEVLAKNPVRHGYCFQADVATNTEAIHVAIGPAAAVDESMPYGGPDGFGLGKCENGPSVYGGTISCISASGGQFIYVEEY